MKNRLNTLLVAVPVLLTALLSTAAWSQTYKPDWATKLVLAKNGNDPSFTTTILAGANGGNLTLTLPSAAPGGNGYILSATTTGGMSWVDPAGSVTLAGDVTGAANSNTVTKINGVSLGLTTATSGNMLIADGESWITRAMSGDATINSTGALTLATSGVTAASYGDATHTTQVTFDAKGRATTASSVAITGLAAGTSNLTTNHILVGTAGGVTGDVPLSGDATIVASGALTLANSGVTATTYGDATHTTQVTFDAKGRATSASSVAITGLAESAITDLESDLAARAMTSTTITGTSGLTGGGDLSANRQISLDVTNANTWSGAQTFGKVALTQATGTTANATEDNYAIGTANSYYYLASTATSGTVISSLAGGVDGRVIIVVNNGAKNITLLNDDGATGTAANRFKFAGGAGDNLIIAPDGIVTLVYDGTSTNHRWRLVSAQ